jgi:hypothetical protein
MSIQRIIVLVGASLLTGCSNGLNTDCEWPEEAAPFLRIHDGSDANHLRLDVELAEELSIRFGDQRWAPGPARQRGRDEQCLAPLLQHIADSHGVPLQEVLSARERIGDRGMNLGVNVPVGLVVGLLAAVLLKRIDRRFSVVDEPLAVAAGTLVAALFIGGVTVAIGRLWEAAYETIRLGNGHLSYRGLRLPWTQHAFEFAVIATAMFVVVSIGYFLSRWIHQRKMSSSWHAV